MTVRCLSYCRVRYCYCSVLKGACYSVTLLYARGGGGGGDDGGTAGWNNMSNRDRYDRAAQQRQHSSGQPSPGRRRRESANGRGQGSTLDLVKELASIRDNDPVMYPAAYERLRVIA